MTDSRRKPQFLAQMSLEQQTTVATAFVVAPSSRGFWTQSARFLQGVTHEEANAAYEWLVDFASRTKGLARLAIRHLLAGGDAADLCLICHGTGVESAQESEAYPALCHHCKGSGLR